MAQPAFTPAEVLERSVLRKVLARLAPFIAMLYAFCLLDRSNVSFAALTMQKDLRFNDQVYGLGAAMFFVGYVIFEVPSNLIMERVGARRWIARIMVTWGLVSASMMFVKSPVSFYTLRFILGVAEAGFFPGIILYLTYWVPSGVRARVIARFLALTTVLGLMGPPLGGLLLKMNGVMGLAGWQWLFLLEGIPSIVIGFGVLLLLTDGPEKVRWLTREEKDWIASRLAHETSNQHCLQHLSLRVAVTDPRFLLLCAIFITTSVGMNAVGFFAPKILVARSGGAWSNSFVATILVVPALIGALAMQLAASHSDRTGRRRLHVTVGYFIAAVGFLACVFAPSAWWVIAALSLNVLGERTAAGSYWAVTTNLLGARAAAGGIALINSVGNSGGFFGPIIMGTLVKASGGNYTTGLYASAFMVLIGAGLSFFLRRQPAQQELESPSESDSVDLAVVAAEASSA